MRERLVAYLLNDLEPAERAALEELLAGDPELRQELQRVRECLATCQQSEAIEEAPPQLASRTCSFVEHAIAKSQVIGRSRRGSKSLSESHDPLRPARRWSAADMVIGACVLAAITALLLPSLRANRDVARRMTCQNNMHQLGAALMDFTLRFNQGLPQIERDDNAGIFVVALADSGVLSREQVAQLVVCPGTDLADRVASGCVKIRIPTREEYLAAVGAERELLRRFMAGDYAYSLGYRDNAGQIRQVHFSGSRHVPLLADAPSQAIPGYQSANHGGCGQNVLFQDLSVKYSTQCKCRQKRDHWFLNDDGQVAAGRHENDLVLGGSATTPIIQISAK